MLLLVPVLGLRGVDRKVGECLRDVQMKYLHHLPKYQQEKWYQ